MIQHIAEHAARLDAFLATREPFLSRAKAQQAIEEGRISVNGKRILKSSHRLEAEDRIEIAESDLPSRQHVGALDLQLPILYEDEDCLVIDKPAGIAVHHGVGTGNAPTILQGIAALFEARKLPFESRSVLVHRLDKGTTGCLLIAKTPQAHLFLQKQFEERRVEKTYLAIVSGVPKHQTAVVDAPLGRSAIDRTKMSVRGVSGNRQAKTTYRVLESDREQIASLIECDLHTGRTHQIRVHLQSIGHSILGDPAYGSPVSKTLSEQCGAASICLHAWQLSFSALDGKRVTLHAPVPAFFRDIADRFGLTARLP